LGPLYLSVAWIPLGAVGAVSLARRRDLALSAAMVAYPLFEIAVATRLLGHAFPIGPLLFPWTAILLTVLTIIMVLVVIRRFVDDRRNRERLARELEAARLVQNGLL